MTLQELLVHNSSSKAHKVLEDTELKQIKTASLLRKNKEAANKILLGALAQLESATPTSHEVKEQVWI